MLVREMLVRYVFTITVIAINPSTIAHKGQVFIRFMRALIANMPSTINCLAKVGVEKRPAYFGFRLAPSSSLRFSWVS